MRGGLKAFLILAALVASGSKALAGFTAVTCQGLKTIEVLNSDIPFSTDSQSYVYVTGSLRHFVTKKPGCVLVTFSAPSQPFDNYIAIQMVGNGFSCLPSGSNNVNLFAGPDSNTEAYSNSMTFLCPDVAAGRHGIQAQMKTYFSTPVAVLYGYTMTVAHR